MSLWWSGIENFEKIFWFIAFPSTIIFIFQVIFTLFGIGYRGGIPGEIKVMPQKLLSQNISDNAWGTLDFKWKFRLITIRSLVVFFCVFSWSGILSVASGRGKITTVIIASISGFAMMVIISYLFYFLTKFVEDGTMNINNAINKEGIVYLTISKERETSGKVEVVVQGALRLIDAVTDGVAIPTGSKIVVMSIVDSQLLLVKKID